jgi:hypothetical protein
MEKRKIIFENYDTAAHGWTLTDWAFSAPEHKSHYVDKPAGDGTWDLSTALSDGLPRYSDRKLTAIFECSEGTRLEREETIRQMVNQLDGQRVQIQLPDDATHYVVGRLSVAREYNNLAHARVSVSAVCEPWKYAKQETIVPLDVMPNQNAVILYNDGRRAVVPTLTVEGTGVSVLIEYRGQSQAMNEGTYQWPLLLLTPGSHSVTYSGSGRLVIQYREAVLE